MKHTVLLSIFAVLIAFFATGSHLSQVFSIHHSSPQIRLKRRTYITQKVAKLSRSAAGRFSFAKMFLAARNLRSRFALNPIEPPVLCRPAASQPKTLVSLLRLPPPIPPPIAA